MREKNDCELQVKTCVGVVNVKLKRTQKMGRWRPTSESYVWCTRGTTAPDA